MDFREDLTELLSPAFSSAIGIDEENAPTALAAFLRATVIHSGVTDAKEIGKLSSCRVLENYPDGAIQVLLNNPESLRAVSIVKTFDSSVYDAPLSVPDEWVEHDTNRPFANLYLSQFADEAQSKPKNTRCFVNTSQKKIVILLYSRRIPSIWVQALISLLPTLMPWYFPSCEEAIALGKRLSYVPRGDQELAKNTLVQYCKDAANKLDIKALITRTCLSGCANAIRENKLRESQQFIDSVRSTITELSNRLRDKYRQLETALFELHAFEAAGDNSDEEIVRFFLGHKDINIVAVDEHGTIDYGVTAPLQYYDTEEYTQMINNKRSWLYQDPYKSLVPIMNAILCDKKGVFRVNAAFRLSAMRLVTMVTSRLTDTDCAPNPHIYFFGCGGGNNAYYTQYAESRDWDLAVEQSCSATRNLNVGDSMVFKAFIDWLQHKDHQDVKCIWVNPDLSPVDIDTITDTTELITFPEFIKRFAASQKGANDNG